MVELGLYRHFKGGEYRVLGVARHSETWEEMVLYEPLYASEVKFVVRPMRMFSDLVEFEGERVPRFKKID